MPVKKTAKKKPVAKKAVKKAAKKSVKKKLTLCDIYDEAKYKIDWENVPQGSAFTAKVAGWKISKGRLRIYQNRGEVYLCQNTIQGSLISERFGFKYSWLTSIENDLFSLRDSEIIFHTIAGIKIPEVKLAEIVLNEDYKARIFPGKVLVGCQSFPNDTIREVVKHLIDLHSANDQNLSRC